MYMNREFKRSLVLEQAIAARIALINRSNYVTIERCGKTVKIVKIIEPNVTCTIESGSIICSCVLQQWRVEFHNLSVIATSS